MHLWLGEVRFLLLLLPAALAGWHAFKHGKTAGGIVRFAVLGSAVISLTRPYVSFENEMQSSPEQLVLLRDTSHGIGMRGRSEADSFIQRAKSRSQPQRLLLIESEGKLWLAAHRTLSSIPPGQSGRFVLLTDGRFPPAEKDALLSFASGSPIPIDVVPLSPTRPDDAAVEEIHLKQKRLKIGEALAADIQIACGSAIPRAKLEVSVDGRPIFLKEIDVSVSQKKIRVHYKPAKEGIHILSARLLVNDSVPANNSISNPFAVSGRTSVLVAAQEQREARFLVAALKREGFEVAFILAAELPDEQKGYRRFDSVLLYDVPPMLNEEQDRALHDFVRKQGGGMVFVAGPRAFSLGAHVGTMLGQLLPVAPSIPKETEKFRVALGLVLDTSGSMGERAGGRRKIDLVVEAARRASELLKPEIDELGVLAFAGQARWIVSLQRLRELKFVASHLQRLQPGGETELLPALTKIRLAMDQSSASIRHVIVLSDGRTTGKKEYFYDVAEKMRATGVTLSTVAVGLAAQDGLMREMANRGGGQFYLARSVHELPAIFTQDTRRHTRSGLVEESSSVRLKEGSDWQGAIEFDKAPPLLGYVASRPLRGSHVALQLEGGSPLMTWCSRGLGRVALFASDAGDRWGRLWVNRWDGYSAFWSQLQRFVTRSSRDNITATFVDSLSGPGIRFEFEKGIPAGSWEIGSGQSNIKFPKSKLVILSASVGWTVLLDTPSPGIYRIELMSGSRKIELPLQVRPHEENRYLTPDEPFLREIARLSSGRYSPNPNEWPPVRPLPRTLSLSSYFLVLAALLLLVDAVVEKS